MARDRTFEFKKHIESIQGRPQYNQMNGGELRARRKKPFVSEPLLATYSDFMKRSREAAHDLYSTYHKLQALNEMARRTTMFDWEETSKEMNELIHVIRIDIKNLNQQIEELRKCQVNGSNSSSSNGPGHDMESHSKTVILNLQHKLASMSSSFKSTLEMRTQKSEQQKMRREQFSSSELSSLMRKNTSSTAIDLFDTSSGTAAAPSGGLYGANGQSGQQQLLVYNDQSTAYLEDRANAMQSVETTIVELGTIFNQLATMVQHQEEMITRIDANVTDTALNVESAHQSLLQYFQTVSNNRWLMFKVFGVLAAFFVVFVLFAG